MKLKSKDEQMLAEAYLQIFEKKAVKCSHAMSPENCDCDNCTDCKKNQKSKVEEAKKAKKNKPDYLDADEDGDTKESMKKALRDKQQ